VSRFIDRTPASFFNFAKSTCLVSDIYLVFGNFSGSGIIEFLGLCLDSPFTFRFTVPETGLLRSVEDGKGNSLNIKYERVKPQKGSGSRMSVLSEYHLDTSGAGGKGKGYSYERAVTHTKTGSFLGFSNVSVTTATSQIKSEFKHDNDSTSVPVFTTRTDFRIPNVFHSTKNDYERKTVRGIPYYRLKKEIQGYSNASMSQYATSQREYTTYQSDFCADDLIERKSIGSLQTLTKYTKPGNLKDHLTCLPVQMTMIGSHSDPIKDFRHEVFISRDQYGLPLEIKGDFRRRERAPKNSVWERL
jgi:hypothetical protein